MDLERDIARLYCEKVECLGLALGQNAPSWDESEGRNTIITNSLRLAADRNSCLLRPFLSEQQQALTMSSAAPFLFFSSFASSHIVHCTKHSFINSPIPRNHSFLLQPASVRHSFHPSFCT